VSLMTRKVDAFCFPRGFGGDQPARSQHASINQQFAILAGTQRLWYSQCGDIVFAIPCTSARNYATDTHMMGILYPTGHPLGGQDKYEWFVAERDEAGRWRPAGYCESAFELAWLPKLGYLKRDPAAGDPAAEQSISEVRESASERARNMLRFIMSDGPSYFRMKEKLGVTDLEMEALFGHVDRRTA
jgi:hypothetical protein